MDYIVRMIAKDAPIKAMAIQGREMVQRARDPPYISGCHSGPGAHADGGLHDGTAD